MNKIKKLIKDNSNVLVFDVDGVLALLEWGEHNHYGLLDNEWYKACEEGLNAYTEKAVSTKMQNFLKNKDMSKVYVITTIGSHNEGEFKREYVNKYYSIPKENVYYVKDNEQKTKRLFDIKENYPYLKDYQIIMVEDNVGILNDIMEKTDFSTVHISSFLDI
ncbi:MAG: hypothetical protein IKG14_04575 [Clostridia bacterium]|nr:hypothetical protein [Clostridia bacterium]